MHFQEMTDYERRIRRDALFSISSPEMDALQKRHEVATSVEERFLIVCEMSDLSIKLAIQAIRDEYPQWTKNEVMLEYFRWVCYPQPLPPGAVESITKHCYRA